jgi:uncharacterized membrane protein YgcG
MNSSNMTGRIYNGKIHEYTPQGSRTLRTLFRGRLNWRLQNGEYAWIDVVCFRDNPDSDNNGLVGFLENNYVGIEGHAIELQAQLVPTEKQKSHTIKLKGGKNKDIDGIKYDSFELVIDNAGFVPTSAGDKPGEYTELDEDDLDDEDLEDEEDDMILEDEEPEEEPAPRSGRGSSNRNQSSGRNQPAGRGNGGSSARSGAGNSNRSGNRSQGNNRAAGSSTSRSSGGTSRTSKKNDDKDFFMKD